MSDPHLSIYACAHPDDVVAVFDHPAVWIDGTAIQVKSKSGLPRGAFFVERGGVTVGGPYAVPWGASSASSCVASVPGEEKGLDIVSRNSVIGQHRVQYLLGLWQQIVASYCLDSQLCHECGSSCGGEHSYDGRSAAWCLEQYELTQRDDPTVDLSIQLTPRQISAARDLWRQVFLGLVQAGSGGRR